VGAVREHGRLPCRYGSAGKGVRAEKKDIYRDSLEWALELSKKEKLYIREYENGISAYQAFADSVERLKIGIDSQDELLSRYMVFVSAVAMIIDNRTYARLFLNEMAGEITAVSEPLRRVSERYLEEIKSVWKIWNLCGVRKEGAEAWPSVKRDHDAAKAARAFADPKLRSERAEILRGAAAYEAEAAKAIEDALRDWPRP
jgi:hypothetical protein